MQLLTITKQSYYLAPIIRSITWHKHMHLLTKFHPLLIQCNIYIILGAKTFMSGRCYQNMATAQILHAQVL